MAEKRREKELSPPMFAVHNRLALPLLVVSFCVTSAAWVALIYGVGAEVDRSQAVGRSVVYVVFMAAVHWVGYRLWRRQFTQPPEDGVPMPPSPIIAAYRPATRLALLQQGIVIVLTAAMLDGGLCFNTALIALIAYWLAYGIVIVRRPCTPSKVDLILVRYGFLAIFAVVIIAGPWVWRAVGRL